MSDKRTLIEFDEPVTVHLSLDNGMGELTKATLRDVRWIEEDPMADLLKIGSGRTAYHYSLALKAAIGVTKPKE